MTNKQINESTNQRNYIKLTLDHKNMKNIIITGTSRGIGFEMVHLFANAGHNVLALSRNQKPVSNLTSTNFLVLSVKILYNDPRHICVIPELLAI